MIYHSLSHTVTTYGIIFLGNSSHNTQEFGMQGKVIRIIMGRGRRELFWGIVQKNCYVAW
jgi:hypothetical protein